MPAPNFSPLVRDLLSNSELYQLVPTAADQNICALLANTTTESLFDEAPVVDWKMAQCCLAGLWLYVDDLDRSHTISQSIDTVEGSFWHAIMHRREGDFDNSKYWYRRVGTHPVYESLAVETQSLHHGAARIIPRVLSRDAGWDPYAWVDFCQNAVRREDAMATACQTIARAEWRLLFEYCYRQATGIKADPA